MTRKQQSANDAYLEEYQLAQRLMTQLQAKLEAHAMKQATQRQDWGYAGDLAEITGKLQAAVDFLQ